MINKSISRVTFSGLALMILLAMAETQATVYTHSGPLIRLLLNDRELHNDSDWIAVDGFSSAGNCRVHNNMVILVFSNPNSPDQGDRLFSYAMLAKTTGAPVNVSVDDTHKNAAGYCYLRTMVVQ